MTPVRTTDTPRHTRPAPTEGGRVTSRRRVRLGAAAVLGPAVLALAVALPAHPGAATPPAPMVPVVAPDALATVAPTTPDVVAHIPQTRHSVGPGQTLWGIARFHGISTAALAEANDLPDADLVWAGTTLTIPGGGATVADTGPTVTSPSPAADLPARLRARPDRLAYRPIFARWAGANGIPVDLLEAMTWLESGWQAHQVSPDGAVGIGQLMPATVEHMELLIGVDLDPWVVEDNIRMSARYLRWLLSRSAGDPGAALAGYYQGYASVARNGPFAETDVYVANILALRERF